MESIVTQTVRCSLTYCMYSAPSACTFGLGFLQTPPRGDAFVLLLTFGSANTWDEDFHLTSGRFQKFV